MPHFPSRIAYGCVVLLPEYVPLLIQNNNKILLFLKNKILLFFKNKILLFFKNKILLFFKNKILFWLREPWTLLRLGEPSARHLTGEPSEASQVTSALRN